MRPPEFQSDLRTRPIIFEVKVKKYISCVSKRAQVYFVHSMDNLQLFLVLFERITGSLYSAIGCM